MKLAAIAPISGLTFELTAHAQDAKKPVYWIGEIKVTDMAPTVTTALRQQKQ